MEMSEELEELAAQVPVGQSLVHVLAAVGHGEGLEALILGGMSTEVRDDQGLTPLHLAAGLGNEKAVQILLRYGADIRAKGSQYSSTPFHALARYGKGSSASIILRALLGHGDASALDLIEGDIDGDTPFHVAAINGDAHLLNEMLQVYHTMCASNSSSELHDAAHDLIKPAAGAISATTSTSISVLDLRNKKGQTPLHIAAAQGHYEATVALLNHAQAADLIAGDVDGDTPFHCATVNGDAKLLKQMLDAYHTMCAGKIASDADHHLGSSAATSTISVLDNQNKTGQTPLHYAALMNGRLEAVSLLLQAGASKLVRDDFGSTPFHLASAHCRDASILDMLQLENVNDAVTSNQLTALHCAAVTNCIVAVRWLLAHGALVDALDDGGLTPLHLAAMSGSSQVIESLILTGAANPQQVSRNTGSLPLGLADQFEHHDAAKALVAAIKLSGEERIKDSLWATHRPNGAILLHFFAAYGSEDDLRWLLALLIHNKPGFNKFSNVAADLLNTKDRSGRTAVHWAAMRSNKDALRVLAENKADLNAESKVDCYKTPLSLAVINGEMEFAEELLKWKPKTSKADDWLQGIRTWMYDYYLDKDKQLGKELEILKDGFMKHTNVTINDDPKPLFSEIPPLYLALHAKRDDIAMFIQRHSKGMEDAVNAKGESTGRAALHWATLLQQREIVSQLCRVEAFARELTANAEDKYSKTALQYAIQMKLEEIEKELMLRSDVKSRVDGMYKDRQVYVDAGNAILVGAALIAGVTFAGWLQPPLGYTAYYNLPKLQEEDSFQTYAAVQQHMGVRMFWVFNSLSFSFAIATMIAGLVAVVPIPGTYIATSVAHLRFCLPIASAFLGVSIMFVLAAFAAAGFAVLPPIFEFQANMMATVIVGGIPCLILLAWFAHRLWSLRPEWLRAFQTRILTSTLSTPPPPPPPPPGKSNSPITDFSDSEPDNNIPPHQKRKPALRSEEDSPQRRKMDSFNKISLRVE